MKLEDQVCAIEYSKKLEELGIKQESLFYWILFQEWGVYFNGKYTQEYYRDCVSAFTLAELGEMLPGKLIYCKSENKWECDFYPWEYDFYAEDDSRFVSSCKKETDSRAEMLIHLVESGLVSQEWKDQWLIKEES